MPYVTEYYRDFYQEALLRLRKEFTAPHRDGPPTPGELNYIFTEIALAYMESANLSYTRINDVMGVFACAAQEFYRRKAVPYEQEKIAENGDIDGYKKEPHDISKY